MTFTKPAAITLLSFAVIGAAVAIIGFVNFACRISGLDK